MFYLNKQIQNIIAICNQYKMHQWDSFHFLCHTRSETLVLFCTWSTSQSDWATFPGFNNHMWWVTTTEHRSTEQGWHQCKSSPKSLTKNSMMYVSEEKENEGSKTILKYHWRTNCYLPRYFLYYSFVKTVKTIIIKHIYPSSIDLQKQEHP